MKWRSRKTVGWCLLSIVLGALAAGQAPTNQGHSAELVTLRILVLDGKTGKPVRGREVPIYELASKSSSGKLIEKGFTNESGTYSVTAVKGRFLCAGRDMGTSVRSSEDILTHGVAEANKCNPAVAHVAEPGTLTLFVRRETLQEFLDW